MAQTLRASQGTCHASFLSTHVYARTEQEVNFGDILDHGNGPRLEQHSRDVYRLNRPCPSGSSREPSVIPRDSRGTTLEEVHSALIFACVPDPGSLSDSAKPILKTWEVWLSANLY